MEIQSYQNKAIRTLASCGSIQNDNLHMTLGLLTEVGEIADVFKKNLAYGKEIDWINIKEEVGDTMWYIANLCNINNWNLNEILDTNIKKLEVRYPDKFSSDKAINRDLEVERKILEA